MLFSVVIPVYNVSKYIKACIDSVLSQSFRDFEIICVNDGSTDGSGEILVGYAAANACIKIVDQENGGLSAARNTGLRASSGQYILFLDSDDWIEPDALKILSENLSGEDMICFNGRRYMEETGVYEKPDKMEAEQDLTGWEYYSRYALEYRRFAFVCVVLRLYRRQFLSENNLNFLEGIYHEDNLFTPYACYYARKVKVLPDCLYDYRVRGNSIMTTRSLKHNQDLISIANTLSAFFTSKPDIDKVTIYRSLTQYYQAAFYNAKAEDDEELLPLVDWKLYKKVSRTKVRHRLHYAAMSISPKVFRFVLSRL